MVWRHRPAGMQASNSTADWLVLVLVLVLLVLSGS
jgi:hypothetical protein